MKRYHADTITEHAEGCLVQYAQASALLQLKDERIAALEQNYEVLRKHYHAAAEVHASNATDRQRQLAEVTQQRDTALAALGEVQAAAREMMLAADNLLREREGYRAACALADQLRKKGSGS